MELTRKRKNFLKFANDIKELGYDVYVVEYDDNTDYHNYGWIVNDKDEIGYFQLDRSGEGVAFSTRHKPCCGFGTGFGLDGEVYDGWVKFDREIVDRVFIHHPNWAKSQPNHPLSEIKKWSAKEFLASCWNKEYIKKL